MTENRRSTFYSVLLMLRAVKWYNVSLIAISQYLIAYYVFKADLLKNPFSGDIKLHLIVISTTMAVAGAFIINSFYDVDKDLVNDPDSVVFNRLLGQSLLLNVYAGLNVMSILIAMIASAKVFIFVSLQIIAFWLYSHKLQKLPLIREISAVILAISPFVAIWLHFGILHQGFALYLVSLSIVGFTREVIKDMIGNKGNIIFGYTTVVVLTGKRFTSKWLVAFTTLLTSAYTVAFFAYTDKAGYFSIISWFTIVASMLISWSCFLSKSDKYLLVADSMLKATILVHLISLVISPYIVLL